MKLSIIVPVFNEKNTIVELLRRVEAADLGVVKEIIIVDDFSDDGTKEILAALENKYLVLYHDKNYGKGHALRTGLGRAAGELVVVQDADLEYDPADLRLLVEKIGQPGIDVVYGSRRMGQRYWELKRSSHLFTLGGIFITWLTNFLYKTNLTDQPTCYKMFRSSLLPSLDLKCERFEYCSELTAKLVKMGIGIYEVPIGYNPRTKKEGKKINWRDGLESIWALIKHKFIR